MIKFGLLIVLIPGIINAAGSDELAVQAVSQDKEIQLKVEKTEDLSDATDAALVKTEAEEKKESKKRVRVKSEAGAKGSRSSSKKKKVNKRKLDLDFESCYPTAEQFEAAAKKIKSVINKKLYCQLCRRQFLEAAVLESHNKLFHKEKKS